MTASHPISTDAPAAAAHAHGHGDHTHHHVASFRSLFTVLVILLVMTALTVYTAKFVDLGETGNLILALFIATFKSVLVCAIFMHLWHDKLLNTVVLLTCISLVICFIGFTAIDMASRDALDPTRGNFIGPPPTARANIDAAIERAKAEHGDHAADEHADDDHEGHDHAEEQPN